MLLHPIDVSYPIVCASWTYEQPSPRILFESLFLGAISGTMTVWIRKQMAYSESFTEDLIKRWIISTLGLLTEVLSSLAWREQWKEKVAEPKRKSLLGAALDERRSRQRLCSQGSLVAGPTGKPEQRGPLMEAPEASLPRADSKQ